MKAKPAKAHPVLLKLHSALGPLTGTTTTTMQSFTGVSWTGTKGRLWWPYVPRQDGVLSESMKFAPLGLTKTGRRRPGRWFNPYDVAELHQAIIDCGPDDLVALGLLGGVK